MEIFNEGGINWAWFTELEVNEENSTVEILRFYRIHKYNSVWEDKHLNAITHPEYYHDRIWKESLDGKRIALEYNHPIYGWLKISNPKSLFDYR